MDIQLETVKQKMDNVITTNWVNIWNKMGGHPGMWRYGHFIQAERDKFEGLVQIFPPSKDVFRCFNYFNCFYILAYVIVHSRAIISYLFLFVLNN